MEQEINLIEEAFKFMLLGMGIVFLFLIVLSLILIIQHRVIARFFKNEEQQPRAQTTNTSKFYMNKKIAAIVASIQQFNTK